MTTRTGRIFTGKALPDTPPSILTVNHVTRRDTYVLLLVLLLAALVRLSDLAGGTHFSYDQATLSRLALDIAHGVEFHWTGIESSAGIPNSPMTVYVLVLPFLFTDNPQVVTALIAAFNVVGVGLLWWLALRYFNPTVALIAGLAYALHPHAIHYSRSIWAQDYHTPIILAGLLLALLGFLEGRRWGQWLALPVFVIGLQIHYAAWSLLPVFAWIVWWGRSRVRWWALGGSIALAIITMIPFGVGLMQSSATAAASTGDLLGRFDDLVLRDKALLYMVRLATGLVAPWVGQPFIGVYEFVIEIPHLIAASWLLIGVLVVLGLIVVWWRDGWRWGVLIWLWAVLPFLLFVPNWTGVFPHYFIPNLPVNALLVGVGLAWLLDRVTARRGRVALLAGFGVIVLSQGLTYVAFARAAAQFDTDLQRTPMPYLLQVRDALRPYDDVLISGGTSSESGYDVWRTLLYHDATCVREIVIAAGGVAVFPDGPFAVVTPPDALDPAFGDLYTRDDPIIIPLRVGEGDYRVDVWESAPAWNGPALTALDPVTFDNGVRLTGYALDDDRVYLDWRLTTGGDRAYQYFAHFLDADGERVAQRDASFYPSVYWCAGDRIVTWIDLPDGIPASAETLRVGMYRLDNGSFVNANVLDANANPVSLWVDVPLMAE